MIIDVKIRTQIEGNNHDIASIYRLTEPLHVSCSGKLMLMVNSCALSGTNRLALVLEPNLDSSWAHAQLFAKFSPQVSRGKEGLVKDSIQDV